MLFLISLRLWILLLTCFFLFWLRLFLWFLFYHLLLLIIIVNLLLYLCHLCSLLLLLLCLSECLLYSPSCYINIPYFLRQSSVSHSRFSFSFLRRLEPPTLPAKACFPASFFYVIYFRIVKSLKKGFWGFGVLGLTVLL